MSEWKKMKLGDVVSIKSGLSYKSEFIGKGDNLLLGMGCVSYKENFLDTGVRPYSQDCDPKYLAYPGDLVLATRQQSDNLPILAMPAIIPEKYQGKKIIIGTNLYRVENNSDIDNRFLFFVLKSHDYVNYIRGVKTGTTVQMVSKRNVEEYHFLCPPKEIRERIVAILSRYDSLIENYQKQIKLLEEAAQRLYKEWFVDLRFPGHENTKIVDGVPEGWVKKKIGDIVIYYDKQRKPLSSMQRMNMEKIYPYYGAASLMDYVDDYLFDGVYLLFGEDGTVITPDNYPVLQYVWGKFWVNNHAHVLRGNDDISTEFLYSMFKEMSIADVVTGAAQPKISQGRLSEKKVIMPSMELVMIWSNATKSYFDSIRKMTDEIRLLTEARDRLLPKLMSGEIKS